MRATLILPAAIALALSAGAASAQVAQYDRSADHMWSYGGATYQPMAPVKVVHERHHARHHAAPMVVPIDRTGDHMMYYGPISQ